MITDEGFKFLLRIGDQSERIFKIVLSADRTAIVDLDPPSSINSLQAPSKNTFNRYDSVSREYRTYSKSFEVQHDLIFSNATTQDHTSWYEKGFFDSKDNLLFYFLNTDKQKTFLRSELFLRNTRINTGLRFLIPFKVKEITQSLSNNGVVEDYIVQYSFDNKVSFDIREGIKTEIGLYNTTGTILKRGSVKVESYDVDLKTVTYTLALPITSSEANDPTRVFLLKSSLGDFRIKFLDAETREDKGIPLPDLGDTEIPLTIKLEEILE